MHTADNKSQVDSVHVFLHRFATVCKGILSPFVTTLIIKGIIIWKAFTFSALRTYNISAVLRIFAACRVDESIKLYPEETHFGYLIKQI